MWRFHLVPRSLGSVALGEWALGQCGRKVARQVSARWPDTHVLVNGGNCLWPDVNWAHCVHHGWPCADRRAPVWFRVKNRMVKTLSRHREAKAFGSARLVLANSEKTRRDLIDYIGLEPERIKTVHLGSDPQWNPPAPRQPAAARAWLGIFGDRPLVAFVGALGYDDNKGFDTLWSAWVQFCARSDWDVDLVVAGGGQRVGDWRHQVARAGLAHRTRLLGFTDRVFDLLGAADLLVSPVRYEAYGLNVHEAICRWCPGYRERDGGHCRSLLSQPGGHAPTPP